MDRRRLRTLLIAAIIASLILPVSTALTADETISKRAVGDTVAEPTNNTTVISLRGLAASGDVRNSLLAIGPDGRLQYRHDAYFNYYDIDPRPQRGHSTILLIAQERITGAKCGRGKSERCLRNVVEFVNISTGEHTRIFDRVRPYGNPRDADWHDVDLLSNNRLLIGDIQNNQAYVVNLSTGVIEWGWNAQSEYSINETGGPYPSAWTHLNDVEMVEEGRMMLSLRDQDSVVFIDRESGLDEEYTLGEPDNYSILYEQHNPDFIPAERGGPAVLVADSENNRIIEYQRQNDAWRQSWVWQDTNMSWPRDADRLPNGNTLVTDTNGGRIFELNRNGEIVWEVDAASPYEAERLNTGDESAGGPAAEVAGLESKSARYTTDVSPPLSVRIRAVIYDLIPDKLRHGIEFILPGWISIYEAMSLVVGFVCVLLWAGLEIRWRGYGLPKLLTKDR
jgi:hypothetical protein